MSGLPRSGSTLLCSLLNQRMDVYCSPLSYSLDILSYVNLSIPKNECYLAGYYEPREVLLKNLFHSFYSNKNVSFVIDKNRRWGNPYTLNLLSNILEYRPKIICPVRPLDEIIASFIRLSEKNPENYIDQSMVSEDFYPYWQKNINDARTDWLLKYNGAISEAMLSLSGAFNQETSDIYHLVEYNDLCENTALALKKIESFLEIPPFDYDLTNIISLEHNDREIYGIPELHRVRSTIIKSDVDSKNILSSYAYEKCKMEDFWTKNKIK